MATVYQAAKEVEAHFRAQVSANTVQTSAIYGYNLGQILRFRSESEAVRLNSGGGYLFRCRYINGSVECEPFE